MLIILRSLTKLAYSKLKVQYPLVYLSMESEKMFCNDKLMVLAIFWSARIKLFVEYKTAVPFKWVNFSVIMLMQWFQLQLTGILAFPALANDCKYQMWITFHTLFLVSNRYHSAFQNFVKLITWLHLSYQVQKMRSEIITWHHSLFARFRHLGREPRPEPRSGSIMNENVT